MPTPTNQRVPLPAEHLTWAVLLGRWVDFARSALALPDDSPGRRLRACVPDIIMLQAVWFALQHLEDLDAGERGLGLARAAVLIEKHAGALRQQFPGAALPETLRQLIDEAHDQLEKQGRRAMGE